MSTRRLAASWSRAAGLLPGSLPEPPVTMAEEVAKRIPVFVERARGCRVWDSMGRGYLDTTMAWGAVLLGHCDEAVSEAVLRQVNKAVLVSCQTELQANIAARLCGMIPCAQQVFFCKNGSDACTAAARLARAATRRELIVVCTGHYHGFHDWSAARYSGLQGIPSVLRSQVVEFAFEDDDSLERLLKRHAGQVAAVMLEPVRDRDPDPALLRKVSEVTHRHGALLIFDEMMTGFRMAPGGAQEYCNVVPDLACFGKCLANGMPLACVVGPCDLMKRIPTVCMSMTFQYDQLSLAAAEVVLNRIDTADVAPHLAGLGERVRTGLANLSKERKLELFLGGPGCRLSIWLQDGLNEESGARMNLFVERMLALGTVFNGHFLPSTAHTESDVEEFLEKAKCALDVVAEAASAKDLKRFRRIPFNLV